MVIAAAKAAEEMTVADAAADEAGTAVEMVLPASRPLASQLLAAMMLRRQATRRNFAAHIKAAPEIHDTSACEYHAQLVLDRKREREKAACAAAFFSAPSSNKSGDDSASSYYSCQTV